MVDGVGADEQAGATKGQPSDSPPEVVVPPRGEARSEESSVQATDPADERQVGMVREAEEGY